MGMSYPCKRRVKREMKKLKMSKKKEDNNGS